MEGVGIKKKEIWR